MSWSRRAWFTSKFIIMETIKVKIINRSHHQLPEYATPGSAGMDVRAFLPERVDTCVACYNHLANAFTVVDGERFV